VLKVKFAHGLGDCVHFAHQLPLYTRRGHEILVACNPDKQTVFAASGVNVTTDDSDASFVPWHEGKSPNGEARWNNAWRWSKPARNISLPPMPGIGTPEDLWHEYCSVGLNVFPYLPSVAQTTVKAWLSGLARPIILLHTHGNSYASGKNLDFEQCWRLYRNLLQETSGTIVLLDWDNRVPRMAHQRVRHLIDDWARLDTDQLLALIGQADLIIGIDSGPLHAARLTDTPSVGVWLNDRSPLTWSLPRELQVNLVVGPQHQEWSRRSRVPFNLVECPDHHRMVATLTTLATYMLNSPRYLHATRRGTDVLLQWFVRKRMLGAPTGLGAFSDRNLSFDLLLRAISERFVSPCVIETGCIRAEDDFAGAGFSTYVLGCYLHKNGGRLISIDNTVEHCAFATEWTKCFGCNVEIVQSDSIGWLRDNAQTIDVLYLDSLDLSVPSAAHHCLGEVQAAFHCLHASSLIVLDDTCYRSGSYHGKGALAVPWLLEHGWEIIHSGYQTMLSPRRM
jgi:Methyltransferase domain/Glycosyltransferase family 9 (heptosyltransferase)